MWTNVGRKVSESSSLVAVVPHAGRRPCGNRAVLEEKGGEEEEGRRREERRREERRE